MCPHLFNRQTYLKSHSWAYRHAYVREEAKIVETALRITNFNTGM